MFPIMRVLRTVHEVRALRNDLQRNRNSAPRVTVVMTMGALHEGHESLINAAKSSGTFTFVTIFVNPLQFAAGEDLDRYPRTEQADLARCEKLGVDAVFAPLHSAELYPRGSAEQTVIDVPAGRPSQHPRSEAAFRPTFFLGVATVVCKLLHIVQPDDAWFGAKDAQQCCVVRQMVQDLNMTVSIRIGPTCREPNGLAMSSRNKYLTDAEQATAAVVYRALSAGQALWTEYRKRRLQQRQPLTYGALWEAATAALDVLKAESAVCVQYIGLSDAEEWRDLGGGYPLEPQPPDLQADTLLPQTLLVAILSTAVIVGSARLIDNIALSIYEENAPVTGTASSEALASGMHPSTVTKVPRS